MEYLKIFQLYAQTLLPSGLYLQTRFSPQQKHVRVSVKDVYIKCLSIYSDTAVRQAQCTGSTLLLCLGDLEGDTKNISIQAAFFLSRVRHPEVILLSGVALETTPPALHQHSERQ